MNIEAYTLDSLRQLVRDLEKENQQLRNLLHEKSIPVEESSIFQRAPQKPDDYDEDQGGRILPLEVSDETARLFLSRFWGRLDVYAKRGRNGGYYPQCWNRWNAVCPKQNNPKSPCDTCEHQAWRKLEKEQVIQHLKGNKPDGSDAIGVYPLFPDQTCRFLVFDFDNHEKGSETKDFANNDNVWKEEVDALRLICQQNQIPALVERSRSGRGAHVWIFFKQPIPASLARKFGFALLDRGASSINLTTFRYYDRMYPSQDAANSLGNLIALPLQGQPLRLGNSAFVDEFWNAYADQMEILKNTPRLDLKQLDQYLMQWSLDQTGQAFLSGVSLQRERLKPWKRDDRFQPVDVTGILHIVLSDGIYIDALNLTPRIQNQIRCMATIDNPKYFANQKSGRSNYYQFSTIYLGKDIDGYIRIPRGLLETVIRKCTEAHITYDIDDQRQTGRPIRVRFNGELRAQQKQSIRHLLSQETGVLSSATGSGKTVMCSYIISQRKVNTLILVSSNDLVSQWKEELTHFLELDEPLPTYKTASGKTKVRDEIIGTLGSGIDKRGGIIDIAMVGSAFKRGKFVDDLENYGMVIMDECQHAASPQAQAVLQKIHSKYVYGVSATPIRSDNLEKINYMLLGPLRYEYTAKEQAQEQGINLFVRPRFTRIIDVHMPDSDFHAALDLACSSNGRNDQIIRDTKDAIKQGRTPVLLTGRKAHARYLYEQLKDAADHVFLIYGDQSQKENDLVRSRMQRVVDQESLILIATGQKIGEGFNYPRLDTLFLTTPVKFDGRLTQYAGRLSRLYPGKEDVIIYDYVDSHIRIFDNQYKNRLRAYKRLGYKILSDASTEKQTANIIFDNRNYTEIFERDLIEAEHEIIISSPSLIASKVNRMIELVLPRLESGVKITIITLDPEKIHFGDSSTIHRMIEMLKKEGIVVQTTGSESEHFAVFDKKLVWHGGMNLLGHIDAWDNLMRIESPQAAEELLEMAFQAFDEQE